MEQSDNFPFVKMATDRALDIFFKQRYQYLSLYFLIYFAQKSLYFSHPCNDFETVGGLTDGERAVPLTAGTKGDSDTDAFIRCAKAEIADTLHAIDDSRTRARDLEAERSYRQISRERLGIRGERE